MKLLRLWVPRRHIDADHLLKETVTRCPRLDLEHGSKYNVKRKRCACSATGIRQAPALCPPPADRPSAEPSGPLRADVPAAGGAEPTPRPLSPAHLPEMAASGPTPAGCALKHPAALATAVLGAPSILLATPQPSSRTAAREGITEALS